MKTKFKKGYYKAISFAIALLMILLSLPASYVYANEGETSSQTLSQETHSDGGELSTDPDEPLPDGKDDKEDGNGAKGEVLPPDVPEPTYLEDGVYAIKNVGNSTMYFDTRANTVYSGGYMQQFAYSALPTTSFSRGALFKIKRVSGTQYIIRLMTNNALTFDVSGSNIVTKEIPYANSSVSSSDRILISETSTSGVFTISPYGSGVYISAPNSTTSGGSSESSKLITTTSSSSSRAQWTFTKYTGAHKQDMQVIGAESLIAGNTYTLRPTFYSTKVDYNMPVLDMQYANSSAFTLTGPTANGLYTIQIHQAQENMLVGLFVSNGSSRDVIRYDIWDLTLLMEERTYYFNNVELDNLYMQIDNNATTVQEGACMELHSIDGRDFQQWYLTHVIDGYFKITSIGSGKALTSPSSVDNSVTQTVYTGADNQLWKFAKLSNGTYRITSKLNGRYLAAGEGILGEVAANGRNVEVRYSQSDGKDEWFLIKRTDIRCVGIPDSDHQNCDHTSTFPDIYSNMQQQGFSSFQEYEYLNASQLAAMMSFSEIIVTNSHGSKTKICLNDTDFRVTDVNALSNGIFNNLKLVLYVACETGKDRSGANNLVNATANKGAQIVIGFEKEIYCGESDIWVEAFFESLGEGNTVGAAINAAKTKVLNSWTDYEITTDPCYCVGDQSTVITKGGN